jgi:hypothetical protein
VICAIAFLVRVGRVRAGEDVASLSWFVAPASAAVRSSPAFFGDVGALDVDLHLARSACRHTDALSRRSYHRSRHAVKHRAVRARGTSSARLADTPRTLALTSRFDFMGDAVYGPRRAIVAQRRFA